MCTRGIVEAVARTRDTLNIVRRGQTGTAGVTACLRGLSGSNFDPEGASASVVQETMHDILEHPNFREVLSDASGLHCNGHQRERRRAVGSPPSAPSALVPPSGRALGR